MQAQVGKRGGGRKRRWARGEGDTRGGCATGFAPYALQTHLLCCPTCALPWQTSRRSSLNLLRGLIPTAELRHIVAPGTRAERAAVASRVECRVTRKACGRAALGGEGEMVLRSRPLYCELVELVQLHDSAPRCVCARFRWCHHGYAYYCSAPAAQAHHTCLELSQQVRRARARLRAARRWQGRSNTARGRGAASALTRPLQVVQIHHTPPRPPGAAAPMNAGAPTRSAASYQPGQRRARLDPTSKALSFARRFHVAAAMTIIRIRKRVPSPLRGAGRARHRS